MIRKTQRADSWGRFRSRDLVGRALPALALATTPAHYDLPGHAQAFVTGPLRYL